MSLSSRRTMVALAAAGAVAAVAWRRTRSSAPAAIHAVAHRTSVARGAQIGAVGIRSAGRYASHRARRTFADAARKEALDTEFQLRTAEEVASTLGNMKGAMMKIGQMASYLDQGLPEPVRDALSQLRSDAPPMAPELAARVIEEELGQAPDRLFAEWDPTPIASASIGQVHRALTHDGRAVAVKVQYPGIADAIEADLVHANLVFGGLGMAFPGLEPGPLVEELRTRLVEELDYSLEARNQRDFAAFYRDHPFIHIPSVVEPLSTDRVLTTDLAAGESFDELVKDDRARRDAAAEAIYRFVFRSLYRMRIFNGDPHPGNYLFGPDGRVTFLDFGLVKRFEPTELQVFNDMVEAMSVTRDTARYRRIVEEIGLLRRDPSLSDDEVAAYFGGFYDAIHERGPFTITSEWASELVRKVFDQTGEHASVQRAANVPPSFVIIQRINLGLYAILGELEATADWRSISEELWPFVDGPPATPMGEAEAEWIARRAAEDGSEVA